MLKLFDPIIEIRDERQLKSVCGVTESQLEIIAREFELGACRTYQDYAKIH
jgi:hypothetical protein